MEESEYNERVKTLEKEHKDKMNALHWEYGLSQAKFKKGDIIRDSRWTILIDKITVSKFMGPPMPVYSGPELKKDLTPKANGNRESIHGNNGVELVKSA